MVVIDLTDWEIKLDGIGIQLFRGDPCCKNCIFVEDGDTLSIDDNLQGTWSIVGVYRRLSTYRIQKL